MIDASTGELIEVILYVQDMNAQVAFYRDALGLSVKEPEGVNDFRDFYSVELYTGSCTLKLHVSAQSPGYQETPRLVFRVADITISRQKLLGREIEVSEIYAPAKGLFLCDCRDPEGNVFSLESRNDTPFNPVEVTPTPSTTPIYVSVRSRRGRSITLLRDNKWLMMAEILFVSMLLLSASLSNVVSFVTPLLAVMALLWLSGNNWNKLGLRKPGRWRNSILAGTITGILLTLLNLLVIIPLGSLLLHIPLRAHIFTSANTGNVLTFVGTLITIWTTQAFAEEMIFRGYLLNRLADLFEHQLSGWTLACFAQAIIFGLTRLSSGITAMTSAFLFGLIWGLLYFLARRNLWSCIVSHGVTGTIMLLLSLIKF